MRGRSLPRLLRTNVCLLVFLCFPFLLASCCYGARTSGRISLGLWASNGAVVAPGPLASEDAVAGLRDTSVAYVESGGEVE